MCSKSMRYTRREFALFGSTELGTLFSGCSQYPTIFSPTLDLEVSNYTTKTQCVIVEILQPDKYGYESALVVQREIDVPPPRGEKFAGKISEADIATRRPYILRAVVWNGDGQWRHHHFFPGERATDPNRESLTIHIYQDEEDGELYLKFM